MSPTIVRKEGGLDAKEVKIMRNSLLNMVLTTKFGDREGKIHQNAPKCSRFRFRWWCGDW